MFATYCEPVFDPSSFLLLPSCCDAVCVCVGVELICDLCVVATTPSSCCAPQVRGDAEKGALCLAAVRAANTAHGTHGAARHTQPFRQHRIAATASAAQNLIPETPPGARARRQQLRWCATTASGFVCVCDMPNGFYGRREHGGCTGVSYTSAPLDCVTHNLHTTHV